jgi:prolyl-tRNA synthetase
MADSPISSRSKDFAGWYQDVVLQGDMAEPAEVVKGCMVIKPNGYAVWEILQNELDRRLKSTGHRNIYLPLLIPQSFLRKESEHIEGFSPELAVVTIAGAKELEEPYVIRPTSETIVGHFFSKWIRSYRDLPILINQWANIVRWELRTRMFLRTTEFLWQEGHTAHATHDEAVAEVLRILDLYADVAEQVLAMPVIKGVKTRAEKFAGAVKSYSIEAMMQNGLALQAGTSHDLGQNFGRAFNVQFQTKEGTLDYVWQTSWGASTRLIGGLIMTHSDDKGLVLPPKVAPQKAVLVPIYRNDDERTAVMEVAGRLSTEMAVHIDTRDTYTPGAKFFYWERQGVPCVFELGPRDVTAGKIVIKRRNTGSKEAIPLAEAGTKLAHTLDEMQRDLYLAAKKRLTDNTVLANSLAEVRSILSDVTAETGGGKFVMAHVKDDPASDATLKGFGATVRNIPLRDEFDGCGKCIVTGETVDRRVVIAKAY